MFIAFIKKFFTVPELEGPTWFSYLSAVHHIDPALNITPVRHIQSKYSASDGDSVKAALSDNQVGCVLIYFVGARMIFL